MNSYDNDYIASLLVDSNNPTGFRLTFSNPAGTSFSLVSDSNDSVEYGISLACNTPVGLDSSYVTPSVLDQSATGPNHTFVADFIGTNATPLKRKVIWLAMTLHRHSPELHAGLYRGTLSIAISEI